MSDHVLDLDMESASQVTRQMQGSPQLGPIAEKVSIAMPSVLDSDRGPIKTDGMATADCQVDKLVDASRRRDDEMGADVRELMELGIGMVGREGVVDGSDTAGE